MTSRADLRRSALELHLGGATYQEICNQLGIASTQTSYKLVQEALDEIAAPAPIEVGAEHTAAVARLDAMLVGLWPKARRGDVQAIDRVLKIEERRSALQALSRAAAPPATGKATGLSDFEKRLREREQRTAKRTRRTQTG